MRILKWLLLGFGAGILLTVGYLLISAHQSALWLDGEFVRMSRAWTVKVNAGDVKSSTQNGDSEGLHSATDNVRRSRVKSITPAECTYGPVFGWGEFDWTFRSQCVVYVTFDEGPVRFDVELAGLWKEWRITSMNADDNEHSGHAPFDQSVQTRVN